MYYVEFDGSSIIFIRIISISDKRVSYDVNVKTKCQSVCIVLSLCG